ncbi:MAG: DUF1648 domain-containing protein [Clostridiales bacterium]|nr:DUF1648 domain-containing protein [Clostridiales bacterium]
MKQTKIFTFFVTGIMLIVAAVSVFYMPDKIAVQWNANGVSNTMSRYMVFLLPALCLFVFYTRTQQMNRQEAAAQTDWVGLLVPLFLLLILGTIVANALGFVDVLSFNSALAETISMLVLGCILAVMGNALPKHSINFAIGVKAVHAYASSDLWTQTQRFAAKLWVIAGLTLMLAAFLPFKGKGVLILPTILLLALLPRLYAKYRYEKSIGDKASK